MIPRFDKLSSPSDVAKCLSIFWFSVGRARWPRWRCSFVMWVSNRFKGKYIFMECLQCPSALLLLAKQLRLKSKAVSFAQLLLVGAHSGA